MVYQMVKSKVQSWFQSLVAPEERLKVFYLSITIFFIVGAYTLARELKDSFFVHIVGCEYIPLAKIIAILVLIPLILLYGKLVDVLRKHQLVYFYMLAYGLLGLVITFFLGHPTIGLENADASKWRIFGWLIYFYGEGFPPFIASLFWAFSNSITSPAAAKRNYPIIIAVSKTGGICSAFFAITWLSSGKVTNLLKISEVANHQLLFGVMSTLLMLVPLVIYRLMQKVPSRNLHGYEAAYRAEKRGHGEEPVHGFFGRLFSGLVLLLKYPYMLGIFSMSFFWEIVNAAVAFQRLNAGKTVALNMCDYTRYLFDGIIRFHIMGLFIVLLGTRYMVRRFGERRSLILVPFATASLVFYYLWAPSAWSVMWVFAVLRAINYAFANPLRESLYIPTTKDMRFKAKSWTDAFGAKMAKSIGSSYNAFVQTLPGSLASGVNFVFFTTLFGIWAFAANMLGRRYEKAIASNEVIGLEKPVIQPTSVQGDVSDLKTN